MNIEQLQYICAVSQHKSITKAAESLFVTQQTVSKAINRLEKELGFQLLIRNYNGIMLTEEGKAFVEKSQEILSLLKELYFINSPNDTAATFSGTIDIYCTDYFIHRVAPKLMHYFSEQYPNVTLRFKGATVRDIVNLVKQENCLGFITTLDDKVGFQKTTDELKSLERYEMPDDDILILLSSKHPLAKHTKIDLKDLNEYSIILAESPGVESILAENYNITLSILTHSSNLVSTIDIIRNSTTLGFITKSILANYTLPDNVLALPLVQNNKAKNCFIHTPNYQLNEIEKEIIKHSSRILSNF